MKSFKSFYSLEVNLMKLGGIDGDLWEDIYFDILFFFFL